MYVFIENIVGLLCLAEKVARVESSGELNKVTVCRSFDHSSLKVFVCANAIIPAF